MRRSLRDDTQEAPSRRSRAVVGSPRSQRWILPLFVVAPCQVGAKEMDSWCHAAHLQNSGQQSGGVALDAPDAHWFRNLEDTIQQKVSPSMAWGDKLRCVSTSPLSTFAPCLAHGSCRWSGAQPMIECSGNTFVSDRVV